MKPPTDIGTVLEVGAYNHTRIFEITENTGKTLLLTELEWSKDLIGQPGCMLRTGCKIRVKLRPDGYVYRKEFGVFDERKNPITILKD